MRIRAPRASETQGYPYLEVEIDGQLAIINLETKLTLYELGIVCLGMEFADRVPPITLPNGKVLWGCTAEPRVQALMDRLGFAANDPTLSSEDWTTDDFSEKLFAGIELDD